MPESRRLLTSLSFVIKLWFERGSPRSLRGRITRVVGRDEDEQRPVSHLNDITAFIETSLQEEGVTVKRGCVWRRRAPSERR